MLTQSVLLSVVLMSVGHWVSCSTVATPSSLAVDWMESIGFGASIVTSNSRKYALSKCNQERCELSLHLNQMVSGTASFKVAPGASNLHMSASTDTVSFATLLDADTCSSSSGSGTLNVQHRGIAFQNARAFFVSLKVKIPGRIPCCC